MTRLLLLAVIGLAPTAAQAQAAATAITAATREGDAGACRVLAPRYEPKSRAKVETPAHFQGGAKLIRPLAAPCPRRSDAQQA